MGVFRAFFAFFNKCMTDAIRLCRVHCKSLREPQPEGFHEAGQCTFFFALSVRTRTNIRDCAPRLYALRLCIPRSALSPAQLTQLEELLRTYLGTFHEVNN